MIPVRKAKIVCTIGPATNSRKMIERLIRAGMDVARLNFSHGTGEVYGEVINLIRGASKKYKKNVAILQDLQGPKIRTGVLKDGKAILKSGSRFILTGRRVIGTSEVVSTTYPAMAGDVKRGDKILLNDGLISLKVNKVRGMDIACEVINGGILTNRKGINLPGIKVGLSSITRKDTEDLIFGISHGVDYVAISFVRTERDVKSVKDIIRKKLVFIPVIAKLEKPDAIENLEKIMDEADGVMVARGDLGVEMSPEAVPVAQKSIINMANRKGKPVITATQMLESMINNPSPTRAEASDIANAIFDGTDAVMLSGETASGKYPVESVEIMSRIISAAESGSLYRHVSDRRRGRISTFPDAVSSAAVHASHQIEAKLIVVFTQSGSTALLVSKQRPAMPIIAYTAYESIMKRLNLLWGVIPETMRLIEDTDDLIREMDRNLISNRLAKKGDPVVILMGMPISRKGATNMMKLHRVGEY
ncbi:MAG: pyruvate kinase [Nitrospinae bacterium RIFCSPLOWO2_02_FULL_39_110]|nr:MAG: pyruvate kinase [Nitrospinae bacterium RIFCSPHIGHO2_02_39_11]OGW01158.1 MAG: pyruvate kinase [Nitrospinae bacterium RIFCSPHIGHO2_12_FULL_39_42]OGW02625.1 MAG: pyruvate kinase [Nitrospinae bacterium RIFCSPHIGHO2_02_FULL_39_82]OGW06606.1 MAG: pyruvate kinase [Nitrospinae bacterium RIFCSPLOWO2_02_FULL_39_110]OGW07204.1 MAG: pyruvate kinase [Nitrospinae bacterium RIFCSPLOWO2_02_39_17]OGW08103.1 MAG: pyruvate kinase [Nitrospinae bacterium RIFCSPLOWO2_12_39_15]OGW11949.1 MAG: pyruvate kinas